MSDEAFKLGAVVNSVLSLTTHTEPADIADAVLAQIKPEDYREALRQALRPVVRIAIGNRRELGVPQPRSSGSPSQKVAAIREGWRKVLESLEHTEKGEWRRLGDFTSRDLLAAADFRVKLASENSAKADQYRALADLVKRSKVTYLRDVPEAQLAPALESAA